MVHGYRRRQRRLPIDLDANALGRHHIDLVRVLRGLDRDVGGFPARQRRLHVLHDEAEVVDDGARRRPGGFGLPQHHEDAGELDQLERAVLHDRAAQHRREELLVGVDVAHRQVDVPHTDADLVRFDQLRR